MSNQVPIAVTEAIGVIERSPLVVVVAGPNGAGKSTTAPRLLKDALAVSEFVNADAIAAGLSAFQPESVALEAGRVMLRRIKTLARQRVDFAFETTLASRSFAPWLDTMRQGGYRVHIAFLSLPNADLAVARVAERVILGGHSVPEGVIRRRFTAGLRAFFGPYQRVTDSWQMLDNSHPGGPVEIASQLPSEPVQVRDHRAWNHLQELAR